jgi:outer membrane protein assembly factor BamB
MTSSFDHNVPGPELVISRAIGLVALAATLAACEPTLPSPPDIPNGGDDRIVWHITQYPGQGTPGYQGDLVYFSARDHSVVAVNRESGDIVWATKLPVALPSYYGTGLVVTGGAVVVGDQDVFGLDLLSGQILWRFAPAGVLKPGLILPAAAGPNVIITSSSGHLSSVVAATGAVNWMTRIGEDDDLRIFRPTVRENDVFISFTQGIISGLQRGGVARVALDDGAIRWWKYLPAPSDTGRRSLTLEPALAGDVLAAASRDGPTFGYRIADGALVWTLPIAPELLGGFGGPSQELAPLASNGKLIFVGSSQGRIRAVDPATGNIVWQRPPGFGGTGWLAADSTHLAAIFPLGDMQLISADDGKLVVHVSKEVITARMTPLMTKDRIYFSGEYGLYAIRR